MTDTAQFGTWLRREIENRLLSQTKFAKRAGISRENVCRYINGTALPQRGVTRVRIAKALGIPREEVEAHLDTQATAA